MTSRVSLSLCGALILAALLSACVSYSPAPIEPQALAEARRGRSPDADAVRSELATIAPDYEWNGEWNALTLLAAALVTNPVLAQARATVVAAEAEATAARVRPGPTLSLTTEYAFNPTEASHWLYGIASDLLLDRGGRRQGRIEAADVAARSATFDYAAAMWSVRMAIRRALDVRATSLAAEEIATELVAMRQRQFEAVNRRVEAGEISRLELDRVRADLATSSRTALDARATVARAAIDLATAVGTVPSALDAERVVETADDATTVPAITAEQIAGALELRPEILQATVAYDRAEAALRIAVASQLPQLQLSPGYTWERGLRKLPFGVLFTLPTSDRARAAIAAAEARRSEAGIQLEAAVVGVEASIAQADADYRAALSVLELVREEILPTATALAQQAERELSAGTLNRVEWAASQAGLLTARLDEVVAIRSALEAEAALEDALHRPLRGPETIVGTSPFTPPEDSHR